MPWLDPKTGQLGVRVVYAGAPKSGKTETINALAKELFQNDQSTSTDLILSPDDANGRTLFFDWLDYSGGVFNSLPIACQILSVPGQNSLTKRRQRILGLADAIVFVSESTEQGIEDSQYYLAELTQHCEEHARQYLVQANKQDLENCVEASAMRAALNLPEWVECLPANALDGDGVKRIFVTAVSHAVTLARSIIGDENTLDTTAQSDKLGNQNITPESLLYEILLEEGSPELAQKYQQRMNSAQADQSEEAEGNQEIDDGHPPAPNPWVGAVSFVNGDISSPPELTESTADQSPKFQPNSAGLYVATLNEWSISGQLIDSRHTEESDGQNAIDRARNVIADFPNAITAQRFFARSETDKKIGYFEFRVGHPSLYDFVAECWQMGDIHALSMRLLAATLRLSRCREQSDVYALRAAGLNQVAIVDQRVLFCDSLFCWPEESATTPPLLDSIAASVEQLQQESPLELPAALNEMRKIGLQLSSQQETVNLLSEALISCME